MTHIFLHRVDHTWAEHSVTDRLETRPPPPPHGNSTNSNTYNSQNVGNLLFMAGMWQTHVFLFAFTSYAVQIPPE